MIAFHTIAIPHDDTLPRCLMGMYAGCVRARDKVGKVEQQGRLFG